MYSVGVLFIIVSQDPRLIESISQDTFLLWLEQRNRCFGGSFPSDSKFWPRNATYCFPYTSQNRWSEPIDDLPDCKEPESAIFSVLESAETEEQH